MKPQPEESRAANSLTPAAAVRACINEIQQGTRHVSRLDVDVGPNKITDLPAVAAILALTPQEQVDVTRELLSRLRITRHGVWLSAKIGGVQAHNFTTVFSRLLQRDLPLGLFELLLFFDKLSLFANDHPNKALPVQAILRAVARFIDRNGVPQELRTALEQFRKQLAIGHYVPNLGGGPIHAPTAPEQSHMSFIDDLLGKAAPSITLECAEPWAAAAERDIKELAAESRAIWSALCTHLHSADGSKPTKKWLAQTRSQINSLGRDGFRGFLTSWLPLACLNRNDHPPNTNPHRPDENLLFSETSEALLKGLAWSASLFNEPEVAAALGDLGETCWRKIPVYGPRSKRAGNAALWALSSIATPAAIAQLVRINGRLRHSSAQKLADKAMNRVADSTGQTREDMEELAFPTFNLDSAGTLIRTVGAFACRLSITAAFDVSLCITDAIGKERKSVPAELRRDHAAELKLIRRTQKEIQAMLAVQRLRFESMLRLPDRRWSFADWRSRYLAHPILSPFARRLIWTFVSKGDSFSAIPYDNAVLTADGSQVDLSAIEDSEVTVRLWHPTAEPPAGVRAWRIFLERHQITPPFKQAHREVYLLTDAERRTGSYSNRFAAHILRQHQLNALCTARGWTYRLQGSWDGGGAVPTLNLPALNLRAEFWVDAIIGEDAPVSGAGVAMNVATDQVRFHRLQPREQLSVEDVNPQVFSEVMRDVDLFVGVCSVGNDPTWSDGGPNGNYRDYWQSISFGNLSASAQTRKEILATLLPRLSIASQCSLDDKFLRVQGALRGYRIHLGSANILMEPNDQYLCIVMDRSAKSHSTSQVYLPFEGDSVLGVILSKAFLLAGDNKITDPTITRQIGDGRIETLH